MRKSSLYSIFLVYFLDNFSFAVVLPLFSSLILTTQFDIIPLTDNLTVRTALLGALVGSFPLALIIGAPIMGIFSDHYGRKSIFIATLSAAIICNIATAIGIHLQSYLFILLSRFATGFFSANLTLCLATISDMHPSHQIRAKSFGTLIAVGGLSWILAMLAGGELSVRALNPDFSPSLPFFLTAGIGLINLLILLAFFSETRCIKKRLVFKFKPLFRQIFSPFQTQQHLRRLFLVEWLFLFSWFFIFQWFSAYSVAAYNMPRDIIGISLSTFGFFWILGAAFLNRRLVYSIALKKIPHFGLIFFLLLLIANSAISQYLPFVAVDCLIALIVSITFANLFNLISLTAPVSIQGKVMGLSQSVMGLAQLTAPLIGSFVPIQNVPALYRISAAAALAALLIYQNSLRRNYAA